MTPPTNLTKPEPLSLNQTFTTLDALPPQPFRLGIQGLGGEGKTFSVLTSFPDVYVLNLDNKLVGFKKQFPESRVKVITFDEDLLVDKLKISNLGFGKKNDPKYQLNIRDGVLAWLTTFGPQLVSGQTLFLDSWTSLQNYFDIQSKLPHEISYTKSGEEDGFKFWGFKQRYSGEIMQLLKSLKCNVVVSFHEVQDYDDDNKPTGKLKPLMQGGYAAQIPTQMTDFYRQRCVTADAKDIEKIKKSLGRDIKGEREWLWQTQTNGLFTACCSVPGMPMYVPASYESLTKKYT